MQSIHMVVVLVCIGDRTISQKIPARVRENLVVKFSLRWKQQYGRQIHRDSNASVSIRPLSRSLINVVGRSEGQPTNT